MANLFRTRSRLVAGHRRVTLGAAAVVAVALVLILPAAALAVAPTVVTSQAFSTAATTA
jgi:hypothetical protein